MAIVMTVEDVGDALLRDFNLLREVVHSLRESYAAARHQYEDSIVYRTAAELAWHLPEVKACDGKDLTCTVSGLHYDLPLPRCGRGVFMSPDYVLAELRDDDWRAWRNVRRLVERAIADAEAAEVING